MRGLLEELWDEAHEPLDPWGLLRKGDLVPGLGQAMATRDVARDLDEGNNISAGVTAGLLGAEVFPAVKALGLLAAPVGAFGREVLSQAPKVGASAQRGAVGTGPYRPRPAPSVQSVNNPQHYLYDIYRKEAIPEMVADAAGRVEPERTDLLGLLGTSREEMAQIADRSGNFEGRPYQAAEPRRQVAAAANVTTRRNANRIEGIIEEARAYPELFEGMKGWYVMDPLFQWMKREYGPERAAQYFERLNALTAAASPNSDVLTEINRGTGANWAAQQGRFDEFMRYAGTSEAKRGKNFPDDMRGILGHMGHSTSQGPAMEKYVIGGLLDGRLPMDSAKVPSYFLASSVPELGFQTAYPVADAHFSRLIGLADVRSPKKQWLHPETGNPVNSAEKRELKAMGLEPVEGVAPNVASASVQEARDIQPWWQSIANRTGLESVPAQAVVWGAGSGRTGVTSNIGQPKLEMFLLQVEKAAQRAGVPMETMLDQVLRGEAYAG